MADLQNKIEDLNNQMDAAIEAYGIAIRKAEEMKKLALALEAQIKDLENEKSIKKESLTETTKENWHEKISEEAYYFFRYTLKLNLAEKYCYTSLTNLDEYSAKRYMKELVNIGLIDDGKFTKVGLAIKAHLNS